MKQVAVIAPQFVPCSYPPAHRVRFFCNHLEEFGWKPVVLCVDHLYMEEPADLEFCRMVPEALEIIRVKALSQKWTRKVGIGDLGIRCFPHMLKRVRQLCRERVIDCLFIPGPPWHTFLIGPRIKREFGIPYVIDYIDPWVSSWGQGSSVFGKAFWYRQMAKVLEPSAVRNADHIVAVSDGTNDGVKACYPDVPERRFTGIPYGGETGDFEFLRQNPRSNPYWEADGSFYRVAYVGAMLPKAYDTLRAFFKACVKLRNKRPDLYTKLRLYFFGTTYDPNPKKGLVSPVAEEMGIGDIVSEYPKRIPYLDAINVLCRADALIGLGTSERHYTASKIFPYILAQRPLLAMYHEASSVVEYVKTARAGEVITFSDEEPVSTKVPEIADKLERLMEQGNTFLRPQAELLKSFAPLTARVMAKRLAEVLNVVNQIAVRR